MTASYRIIDYSLRPAKFAERKMLCEMLARLKVFGSLESYQYVGFGSIWYADCVLFHRGLGIRHIISIEKEMHHEERFAFNNPYRGIELRMGRAADILPHVDWSQRSILWLDYDDPVSPSILEDVRTVATRARPGTMLIVSVQTQQLFDRRDIHDEPVAIEERDHFEECFGVERTPGDMTDEDLYGWQLSKTARRLVREEIENGIHHVNGTKKGVQKLEFCQIVAFEYADGAKMTTIGGLFIDSGQRVVYDSGGFRELTFFRDGTKALRIETPLLTTREMRHLDQSLPCQTAGDLDLGPIPEKDGKNYALLYRYLPNFASFEP
ncbi:MAG: hypothetical protein OXF79_15185 [Chloroflexi bacterium]|nr:hypothetical protein [Chloroflexota bacterium]